MLSSSGSKYAVLVLVLSTLIGLSRAIKCHQCSWRAPDVCQLDKCDSREADRCVKWLRNGKLTIKGCGYKASAEVLRISNGDGCWKGTQKDLNKFYPNITGTTRSEYWEEAESDTGPDTDKVEYCYCRGDGCNSGRAPSVSGLVFGSSLVAFFMTHTYCMLGFILQE